MPYHGVVHCERTYFGSFRTYLGSLQFWLPAQILWTVKTTVLRAKSAANSSISSKFSTTSSLSSFWRLAALAASCPGAPSRPLPKCWPCAPCPLLPGMLVPGRGAMLSTGISTQTRSQMRPRHGDHLLRLWQQRPQSAN